MKILELEEIKEKFQDNNNTYEIISAKYSVYPIYIWEKKKSLFGIILKNVVLNKENKKKYIVVISYDEENEYLIWCNDLLLSNNSKSIKKRIYKTKLQYDYLNNNIENNIISNIEKKDEISKCKYFTINPLNYCKHINKVLFKIDKSDIEKLLMFYQMIIKEGNNPNDVLFENEKLLSKNKIKQNESNLLKEEIKNFIYFENNTKKEKIKEIINNIAKFSKTKSIKDNKNIILSLIEDL